MGVRVWLCFFSTSLSYLLRTKAIDVFCSRCGGDRCLFFIFEQPQYRRPGPWTAVGKQREEAPKHLSTGRALPEKIISDQTSRLALTLFEAFIS